MRKFIIKNRPKRKYTKKAEQNSSLLFGKTFVGMLPLLIMVIVLMATIVISSPTRNPFAAMHFTLDPHALTLQNPLNLLKQYAAVMQDGYNLIGNAFMGFSIILLQTSQKAATASGNAVATLDPRPALVGLGAFFISVGTIVAFFFQSLFTIVQSWLAILMHALISAARVIWISLFTFSTVVVNESMVGVQAIGIGITSTGHAIASLAVFVYHVLQIIVIAIFTWIHIIWVAIVTWIVHTVTSIVKFIEWPFKAAGTYLSQYKPMTDLLGKHIIRALNDTETCFSNLSKTLHLLGSSK